MPHCLPASGRPSSWSGWSRPGEDGKLVTQQQVLSHEVLARPCPGQAGCEQQRDQFIHACSMADLRHPRY
jgi:hypothetical protein